MNGRQRKRRFDQALTLQEREQRPMGDWIRALNRQTGNDPVLIRRASSILTALKQVSNSQPARR